MSRCVTFMFMLLAAATSAQAQVQSPLDCGSSYTIQPGDTLGLIAERVYDDVKRFEELHQANIAAIGNDPHFVRAGTRIELPCLSSATAARSNAEIRIVTGSDYPPYSDRGWPEQGMAPDILRQALAAAAPDLNYRLDVINDWTVHLDPLITEGIYDLALPWSKPNCNIADRLSSYSQFLCRDLKFSEPIFVSVISFFSLKERGYQPTGPKDLFGKTICRPLGYETFDLEENQLVEPNVTLVQAESIPLCFQSLLSGESDYVTLDAWSGEATLRRLDALDKVVEHEELEGRMTLGVVASTTNPEALSVIETINRGIAELNENGTLLALIDQHYQRFSQAP